MRKYLAANRRWLQPFVFCVGASAAFAFLAYLGYSGFDWSFHRPPQLGHVTRAYGTVKIDGVHTGRLESGRSILVPLHEGDQLQTGEDSAAETLFFGGSILQLQGGSVARFEDAGENVAIRILLGRAYFEFPPEAMSGTHFVFKNSEGKLVEMPEGRRLVLTLSSAENLADAVEVRSLDPSQPFDSLADAELKYVALGDREVEGFHPLIVAPINDDDQDRRPSSDPRLNRLTPHVTGPDNEDYANLDESPSLKFAWNPVQGKADDSVIGYEIEVRPAFNYQVEDRARQVQVFKDRSDTMRMDRVGGGGVFLWSVRAVTSSGVRGPASRPRWLEVKFPKQLAAPEFKLQLVK